MGFSKWIGASIGWSFGGPIGAIIGLALGSLLDSSSKVGSLQRADKTQTRSGDFEVSLLVLASIVIKADGKNTNANWILYGHNLSKCMEKSVPTMPLIYLKKYPNKPIFQHARFVCKSVK